MPPTRRCSRSSSATRTFPVGSTLQQTWRRDTLIHGDIKFENCVLTHANGAQVPDGKDAEVGVKVVGPEIADLGDPRWDVGSMMQSWLACWIFSIPTDGATDPEQLAARAVYPWRRCSRRFARSGTATRRQAA